MFFTSEKNSPRTSKFLIAPILLSVSISSSFVPLYCLNPGGILLPPPVGGDIGIVSSVLVCRSLLVFVIVRLVFVEMFLFCDVLLLAIFAILLNARVDLYAYAVKYARFCFVKSLTDVTSLKSSAPILRCYRRSIDNTIIILSFNND